MTDHSGKTRLATDAELSDLSKVLKRFYQHGTPRTPHAKAVQEHWESCNRAVAYSIAKSERLRDILRARLVEAETVYDQLLDTGHYHSAVEQPAYHDHPMLSMLKKRP